MQIKTNNEIIIKKRDPYQNTHTHAHTHTRPSSTGDHDIIIKRISKSLTPDTMQRVGLDLLHTSVVTRDIAGQLGVKDSPIDITERDVQGGDLTS